MDDSGPTASYIIFFALLLLDMLIFGFQTAVKELNMKELSEQSENEVNKKAKRLYEIIMHPDQYVNTVQLIVTIIHLCLGGFFLNLWRNGIERLLERKVVSRFTQLQLHPVLLFALTIILSGGLLLYIILTFGVLIPKKLGARYASQWAYACINPVWFLIKVLSPITGLVSVTARGVLHLFGIKGDENTEDVTEEEIISMVNEGHEQGVLLATEAEMITKIFEFGDKEAEDIMTHRKNILAIDGTMTLGDALDYMLSESKSRFPVYAENIDNITGILHFRDAMRAHKNPDNLSLPVKDIEGLIRETMYVPETKNIDDLFKTMQQTKTQMVVVVDEYGQTSGLIAMEDILEEIVGNIMDEYDEDEEFITETDNADEYVIGGMTPLAELEERFGISFEEKEFETLNGFLISKMDKIPEENEEFSIDVGDYEFRILSVENRMIQSVLVKHKETLQEEGE